MAAKTFSDGVNTPGALERVITMPFGDVPGAVVLEIGKVDLLIHAWDLAQATDQAFDPPAEIVEPALDAAQGIIAPALRNGHIFAAEQTAPANARPIDRLAAFAGRSV
jgi:uncharacterized protein (TIGR03086 family)